jgi:uncharacterized surface anchored protein
MKKKRHALTAIALVFAMLLQFSIFAPVAKAADPPVTFTGISFWADQNCSTPLPTTNVSKTSGVNIRFDYSVSAGANIGDQCLFTIPTEIPITSELTFPVVDATSGDTVANVDVLPGVGGNPAQGTLTLVELENGYFVVGASFSVTGSENETPVPINFTVNGTAFAPAPEVNFAQPAPAIDKSGVFNASTGTIDWTIDVNTNDTTVINGELSDTLPAGLTYEGGTFEVDGTPSAFTTDTSNPSTGVETLAYTFPDTSFSITHTVKFTTNVDPSLYNSSVTNTAYLYYGTDDTSNVSAHNSPAISTNVSYITKSANYDNVNKRIDWTIDFNTSTMSLTNVIVTDPIPSGLVLDGLSNVSIDTYGDNNPQTVDNGTGSGQYSFDNNTLTYYAGDLNTEQELTFSTALPSDYFERDTYYNFSNTAKITGDGVYPVAGVSSNTVDPVLGTVPGTSVLSKTCIYYNYNTQIATWQIEVDQNQVDLPGAILTDTIPSDQDYDGDAAFYTDGTFSNTTSSVGSFSQNSQVLTWSFGDIPAGNTYYIQYTTRLHDDIAAQNGAYTLRNSAELDVTGYPSSTVNPTYSLNRNVISKTSGYDYTTRDITWTLDVNKKQMSLTGNNGAYNGVVVKDDLSGESPFAFDPSSSVTVYSQDAPNTPVTVTPVTSSADLTSANTYYFDPDSKILWIDLGELSSTTIAAREKKIVFVTKLSDSDANTYFADNGNKSVSNTAILLDDQYSGNASSSCTQTINNNVVNKTDKTTAGADYIDWKVIINQNEIDLNDVVLDDTLQAHLILDTSTIGLYQQTLQSSGAFAAGTVTADNPFGIDMNQSVPLTADNISYNASTNVFKFTMPTSINAPYLLVFRTYVSKDQSGASLSFSNTISFKGSATQNTSTVNSVAVHFQWGYGAAGSTPTGNVTVTKEDSESAHLAGAVFELLDHYNNVVQISAPTDSSGTTTFYDVPYNTSGVSYTVKELTPPADYKLSTTSKEFTLTSSSDPGLSAFTDVLKTGTIEFTKLGYQGIKLANAGFTLYNSNGDTVATTTSSATGNVSFSGVQFGNYTIVENAPSDYQPLTIPVYLNDNYYNTEKGFVNINSATVTTDGSGNNTLDLNNVSDTIKTADITFTKQDSGGLPLANATFTLYDADGVTKANSAVNPVVSGSDGVVTFSSVPYGNYIIKETTPPLGYQAVQPINVYLHDADYNSENNLTNLNGDAISNDKLNLGNITDKIISRSITGTIKVVKTDNDGNPLAGAEFSLYNSIGMVVLTATSGTDGIAQFNGVQAGTYTIAETKVPQGYLLSNNKPSVAITASNYLTAQVVSFSDDKVGVITITKVDALDSTKKLSGASFELLDSNGIEIGSPVTTGTDGTASFSGLGYGNYTVEETAAPTGYELNTTAQAAEIIPGNTQIAFTIDDSKMSGTVEIDKTDESGKQLAGAQFTLYSSGAAMETAVSDTNGKAVFTNIPLGDYTIKETYAPKSYSLSSKILNVSITSTNYFDTQTFKIADSKAATTGKTGSGGKNGSGKASSDGKIGPGGKASSDGKVGSGGKANSSGNSPSSGKTSIVSNPDTGDKSIPIIPIAALVLASSGLAMIKLSSNRKRKGKYYLIKK